MGRLSSSAVIALLQSEQAAHAKTREQYDALVKELMALKREGFAVPTVHGPLQAIQQPKIARPIRDAIELTSSPGQDREYRTAQALELLAEGTPEDDVAKMILAGMELPQ